MIFQADKCITVQREQILRDACLCLVSELKQIGPEEFSVFFQLGQMPDVHDMVTTTLDRFYRNNTMGFACTGDTAISWNKPSMVAIDLEFVSEGIFAFFRLFLSANEPTAELHHISFQESAGDPDINTEQLAKAIKRARIPH